MAHIRIVGNDEVYTASSPHGELIIGATGNFNLTILGGSAVSHGSADAPLALMAGDAIQIIGSTIVSIDTTPNTETSF